MLKSPRAFAIAAVLFVAFGGSATIAHAQTTIIDSAINDGSFETPVVTPFSYQPLGTPWTFTDNAGISINTNTDLAFSINGTVPDGNQYAFLQLSGPNNTATISQDFTLAQASNLTISYYLGGRNSAFFLGNTNFSASLDGTPFDLTSTTTGLVLTQHSFDLPNVSAGSHTLLFTASELAGQTNDNTAVLDNVSVVANPASAPEPGSLALVGVGLVSMASLIRRGRHGA